MKWKSNDIPVLENYNAFYASTYSTVKINSLLTCSDSSTPDGIHQILKFYVNGWSLRDPGQLFQVGRGWDSRTSSKLLIHNCFLLWQWQFTPTHQVCELLTAAAWIQLKRGARSLTRRRLTFTYYYTYCLCKQKQVEVSFRNWMELVVKIIDGMTTQFFSKLIIFQMLRVHWRNSWSQ